MYPSMVLKQDVSRKNTLYKKLEYPFTSGNFKLSTGHTNMFSLPVIQHIIPWPSSPVRMSCPSWLRVASVTLFRSTAKPSLCAVATSASACTA